MHEPRQKRDCCSQCQTDDDPEIREVTDDDVYESRFVSYRGRNHGRCHYLGIIRGIIDKGIIGQQTIDLVSRQFIVEDGIFQCVVYRR